MKIIACSSNRSKAGLSRIINLIRPEVQVDIIDNITEIEKYLTDTDNVKFLLHNICNVAPKIIERSVVFGMQSVVNVLSDKKSREIFVKHPPMALWVNSGTAQRKLTEMGIKASVMYRPNRMSIPDKYIIMPKQNRILWYWKNILPDFKQHVRVVIDTVQQLPEVEFVFFPATDVPVVAPNTTAIGRINIIDYCHNNGVRGMVRVTNGFDMGRAMFDVVAAGRWVLTYKLKEPFTHAITKMSMLPDAIRYCLDNYDDVEGMRLWNYARENLAEDMLRVKWIRAIKQVFGI